MVRNLFLLCLAFVCGVANALTDEQIAASLKDGITQDFRAKQRTRNYLLQNCNYDSSRIARVAKEMIEKGTAKEGAYFDYVAEYGSAEDLPFAESFVTNAELGYGACNAVITLGGINSGTLAQVARYHALTNESAADCQTMLFRRILKMSISPFAPEVENQAGVDYAFNYASNSLKRISIIDLALLEHLPSYTNGTTRLDFLTYKLTQPVNDYDRDYLTTAVKNVKLFPRWTPPRERFIKHSKSLY